MSSLGYSGADGRDYRSVATAANHSPPNRIPGVVRRNAAAPRLPLRFEENQGQFEESVHFAARTKRGSILANGTSVTFVSDVTQSLTLHIVEARIRRPKGTRSQGVANYLLGNDPTSWKRNISTFAELRYESIYDGIDLVLYGREGDLEYDFIVAPHVDPSQIALRIEGADDIRIDEQGSLRARAGPIEFEHQAPTIYQDDENGTRRLVDGSYALGPDGAIRFTVGPYDSKLPLVIDPIITYATYLGGNASDIGYDVAVDAAGSAYIVGTTESFAFPLRSPHQPTLDGERDVFVTKLNATGTDIVYSTYLGGSLSDSGAAIAVDASGSAYVTGGTASTDFPAVGGAFPTAKGGTCTTFTLLTFPCSDAFVAKLAPDGASLVFSTYFGGSGDDAADALTIDASGGAHIAGRTLSDDLPIAQAFQPARSGFSADAFVAGFSATGAALTYSTYIGGQEREAAHAVLVDAAGAVFVAGETISSDFPVTPSAWQPTFGGHYCDTFRGVPTSSCGDAFFVKLAPATRALAFASYLGGSRNDIARALAQGSTGLFIAGYTDSSDFRTSTSAPSAYHQGECNNFASGPKPCFDGFLSRLDATGTSIVDSRYLGGAGDDLILDVEERPDGSLAVLGVTDSTDFAAPSLRDRVNSSVLFQSFSSGERWSPASVGLPATDVGKILFTGGPNKELLLAARPDFGLTRADLLYRSSDGGATWTHLETSPSLNGPAGPERINDLVANPSDGATVYALLTLGGLARSLDAGQTWIRLNGTVSRLAVGELPNILYGIETDVVLRSVNRGDSWYPVSAVIPDQGFVGSLAVEPTVPATIYVSVGDAMNRQVYRALAGSSEWTLANNGLPKTSFASLHLGAPGSGLLFARTDSGVFRSLNRGESWQPLSTPATGSPNDFVVVPSIPATLMAAWNDSVYTSVDGGDTWGFGSVVRAGRRIFSLGIDPSNSRRVFAGLSGELFGSLMDVVVAHVDVDGRLIDTKRIGGIDGEGHWGEVAGGMAVDSSGSVFAAGLTKSVDLPVSASAFQRTYGGPPFDAFVAKVTFDNQTDTDSDTLPDTWEHATGLDPLVNDASGDADADGVSNAGEYAQSTHPRGFFTRYFAEGASTEFLSTEFELANPSSTTRALVMMHLLVAGRAPLVHTVEIEPMSRLTFDPRAAALGNAEFSTTIESDVAIIADRTMTWDSARYGAHAETSVSAPSLHWYFAEGATHSGCDLFYLLQNPSLSSPSDVRIRYLLPSGAPIEERHTLAPGSRFTLWVNRIAGLEATDVGAAIDVLTGPPIVVERALYLSRPSRLFEAGHESAGVTEPATTWYLAEGATGPFFDTFALLANPQDQAAAVRATYLLANGETLTKDYQVAPNSRLNVWLDVEEFPAGSGIRLLADTAVSSIFTSTNGVPIVVERSMWWPGPTSTTWAEAHASHGATQAGVRWAVGAGEVGGTSAIETYLLIANTGSTNASVKVTLLHEDGAVSVRTYSIPPTSRFNVAVRDEFPETIGKRFGAVVESVGVAPAPIVVEQATYSNADDRIWAAGTNLLATRLQ